MNAMLRRCYRLARTAGLDRPTARALVLELATALTPPPAPRRRLPSRSW
jgi:hypothetical protein